MRTRFLGCVALAMTAGFVVGPGCNGIAHAQAAQAVASSTAKMLYIDVLEGEGELNDIRARTAREPVVQVKDENHKPVAGALVLFSIRSTGGAQPAASFSGLSTLTVRTGADGTARAHGYQVSRTGNIQILVTVSLGVLAAEVTLHQTNYARGGHLSRALSTHKALVGAVSELTAFAVASSVVVVQAQTSQVPATINAGPPTITASRGTHSTK